MLRTNYARSASHPRHFTSPAVFTVSLGIRVALEPLALDKLGGSIDYGGMHGRQILAKYAAGAPNYFMRYRSMPINAYERIISLSL